jgi:hypothetical protein
VTQKTSYFQIAYYFEEFIGESPVFSQFLEHQDRDQLPKPWRYWKEGEGANRVVKGPGVGFRIQRVGD